MPTPNPVVTLSRGPAEIVLPDHTGDPGYMLLYGSTGLGIAPVDIETVSIPAGHGSLLRHTRLQERDIYLPVAMFGSTFEECDRLRDDLMRLCDPTKGPVRITVQSMTRDGDARWIDAVYADGLSGDYSASFNGYTQSLGLKFKAPAAFWSTDTVTRRWQIAPGIKPFLSTTSPFFPVVLTSASIAGQFDIWVDGDQPVWPVWTVTGPGEDLTIAAGGQQVTFEGQIKTGQMVTLDAGAGDVYDADHTDGELWSRLSLDSEFFQLQPGLNRVQVTFTGASADSILTLAYDPQYLAGY